MKLQIRNYVPEELFQAGKQQNTVRIPCAAFAMVDLYDPNRILACCGQFFTVGTPIPEGMNPAEWQFVLDHKGSSSFIAFLCGERLCLSCTGLSAVGFLPVAVWNESPGEILSAWDYAVGRELLCSPAVQSITRKARPSANLCGAIAEYYRQSKGLFLAQGDATLRNVCVRAAVFTGCRAETVNLPRFPMDVLPTELLRWTAFLLCLFLTLRGSAPSGPSCRLLGDSAELSLEMLHTPAADAPRLCEVLPFLSHPAFQTGFHLEPAAGSYRLEVSLLRPARKPMLRSHTRPYTFSLTLLYENT